MEHIRNEHTEKPRIVFIDCETEGLNPYQKYCHGLGIAFEEDDYAYYKMEDIPDYVKELLKDPDVTVCGHNLNFDRLFLHCNGIDIVGPMADTKLMAQLIDDNESAGLKFLSNKYLGAWSLKSYNIITRWLQTNKFKDWQFVEAPFEMISNYCKEDVQNTLKLYYIFKEKLSEIQEKVNEAGFEEGPIDYYFNEMQPCEEVMFEMKRRGIKVNMNHAAEVKQTVNDSINSLLAKLNELTKDYTAKIIDAKYQQELSKRVTPAGKAKVQRPEFNWNSVQEVGQLFFDEFKAPIYNRTPKGKPSLRSQDMVLYMESDNELLVQVATLYDQYKKNTKLVTTYLENLPKYLESDGKVHADFLHKTVTGRLSSANPNMQNLPKNETIKQLYVPEEGNVFIYADYSQIELRVAAHLSEDKVLINHFISGEDIHQYTANLLDIDRKKAKNINFGIIYGVGPKRICDLLGWELAHDKKPWESPNWDRATKLREGLLEEFSGIKNYLDKVQTFMENHAAIVSMFGRVRRLPDIWSDDKRKIKHAIRQGRNFVVQSAAASITKRAMIELESQGFQIVNQIHDAIIIEVPRENCHVAQKTMEDIMCNVVQLSVPITVESFPLNSFNEEDIV